MVPGTVLILSAHRWNVPVLAHIHPTEGATFSGIRQALSVCRDSLVRTLEALSIPGWVRRREGAYALTPGGKGVAWESRVILETARTHSIESVMLRKWPLPVAAALENWSLSFGELRASVPKITPRALTLALKEMVAAGIVERRVIGGFPPTTSYRLKARGTAFLPALGRLEDLP
jgi:DNA-binding HxlR family transcriptional regulator